MENAFGLGFCGGRAMGFYKNQLPGRGEIFFGTLRCFGRFG
jgi:hypothetical protein